MSTAASIAPPPGAGISRPGAPASDAPASRSLAPPPLVAPSRSIPPPSPGFATRPRTLVPPPPGGGPSSWVVEGEELDQLANRLRAHFAQNEPEPTSFPGMAARVLEAAEQPEVDLEKLARLIEREPATAASVLAVANSALFRRGTPIKSVRGAIGLLGLRQVANIAAGISCRTLFDVEIRVQHALFPAWWSRLFHQAMTVGFASAFFAMSRGAAGDTFLGGMLHGIGKSLALRSLAMMVAAGLVPGVPTDESLTALLRKVHVGFGARAHRVFGLPEALLEICQRQRDLDVPAGRGYRDLHVVRLISGLDELRIGPLDPLGETVTRASARALGLDAEKVRGVAAQVSEHSAQVSLLFGMTDGADEAGLPARLDELLTRELA